MISLNIAYAVGAGLVWGIACGLFRAPYWLVAIGGVAAASLGYWLERGVLFDAETTRRKDFHLLATAAWGFFALVGVGLASLSCLLSRWYLPSLMGH